MKKIKLVIWDLDDTFWRGTLSEGKVYPIKENIDIVKQLINNGIMCSISSKNDYKTAKNKLEEFGIWEYFIFPCINWNAKGEQVKRLLDDCSLRAENTLFLDDNTTNLQEVVFYNPGINVLEVGNSNYLEKLRELEGRLDHKHERLKQYKILEKKRKESIAYSSNEAFLMASDIRVQIKKDCNFHFERLLDLINRSNQLNYTKKRLTQEELKELLNDKSRYTGYVEVKDNYGDYGIVGFFSIIDGVADHFLFSCRTIGMGIEQFVYNTIGTPEISIVGEVRSELKKGVMPKWINKHNCNNIKKDSKNNYILGKANILIDGGCDLQQLIPYLHTGNSKIDYVFNVVNIRHDNTFLWKGAKEYSDHDKKLLIKNVPFIGEETFDIKIYDPTYDIVVISVLMDYTQAVYRSKEDENLVITYGDFNNPITKNLYPDLFDRESVDYLLNNFRFDGRISFEELKSNLQYIRDHIETKTALVIINGCEVPLEHELEVDRYMQHKEYNAVVTQFVNENNNTYLLDMCDIVKSREQLTDNIRHYNREVYYAMAIRLSEMINGIANVNLSATKKKYYIHRIGENFNKIRNKLFKI